MKKLFITTMSAMCLLLAVNTTKAQVSFSLHVGTPPVWAPAEYAHTTRYYYIPEIDSYYDVNRGGYYYADGPNWVFSASLPYAYRNYDVASLHHVVVNYHGERPYTYFAGRRNVYVNQYRPHPFVRQANYRPASHDRGHFDHGNHGGRGPEWHGDHGNHGDHGDHGNHGDHGDHGHHH